MTMESIDLNSDLGESYGAWRMGDDAAMIELVTSANVACGFHAGDPAGILHTVKVAVGRGVAIGALPSRFFCARVGCIGPTPAAARSAM